MLQVCDDGGGSRATTTEADGRVDDACTSLGDANSSRASLAAAAEFFSKLTGSESRADVSLKDESVGMADELECESILWSLYPPLMQRQVREFRAHLRAQALDVSGSAVVAGFYAVQLSGSFAATRLVEAKGDGDGWYVTAITVVAPADTAGAAIFTGDADNVGALVGANRASGAVAVPEVGQTWADVGSFDLYLTCIIGGDQEMAD